MASCVTGACTCVSSLDFGGSGVIPTGDGGTTKHGSGEGCSTASGSAGGAVPGVLLVLCAYPLSRRRRAAVFVRRRP